MSRPKGEELQVHGDSNAKVGDDEHSSWPEVVGKFGLGRANDRRQHLLQCFVIDELVSINTVFQHANTRRATWISPEGRTMNQIDYIFVSEETRRQAKEL